MYRKNVAYIGVVIFAVICTGGLGTIDMIVGYRIQVD